MKIIILGNSGSGKSTLAREIKHRKEVPVLSLDDVAFASEAVRRPVAESLADVRTFIRQHSSWVVEGCYASLIEGIHDQAETLIFLNPGVEQCVQNCLNRPWEPEKFASLEEQNRYLDPLIAWVREYETRTDEFGLQSHREIFEWFAGSKFEITDLSRTNEWLTLHL